MIIDGHIHLSMLRGEKEYKDALKRTKRNMKDNKINKAVIIADNVPDSGCADINILLDLYGQSNNVYLVGALNVLEPLPDDTRKTRALFTEDRIVGLKLFPGHDEYYPTDKRCFLTYLLCLRYNRPVIIHTGINPGNIDAAKYNDPKHIIKIALKYPDLKIIIAHYFWPRLSYCYKMTKSCSNIYFDTSALADKEVIKKSGGRKKIKDILQKTIIERPDNVLLGSDYPMCSIKDHIGLINSLNIPDNLKKKVLYKNARDVFRI